MGDRKLRKRRQTGQNEARGKLKSDLRERCKEICENSVWENQRWRETHKWTHRAMRRANATRGRSSRPAWLSTWQIRNGWVAQNLSWTGNNLVTRQWGWGGAGTTSVGRGGCHLGRVLESDSWGMVTEGRAYGWIRTRRECRWEFGDGGGWLSVRRRSWLALDSRAARLRTAIRVIVRI